MKKINYLLSTVLLLLALFPITSYAYESIDIVNDFSTAIMGLIGIGGLCRIMYKALKMNWDGESGMAILKGIRHILFATILGITLANFLKTISIFYN